MKLFTINNEILDDIVILDSFNKEYMLTYNSDFKTHCPISNISFIKSEEGFLMVGRKFGYVNVGNTTDGIAHRSFTHNQPLPLIFQVDKDFMIKASFQYEKNVGQIPALEDFRIIKWVNDERIYMSGTIYSSSIAYPRFGVCEFDRESLTMKLIFNSNDFNSTWREKNWMCVPDRPFCFLKNISENGCEMFDISTNTLTGTFDRNTSFHGRSSLIKTTDGYYCIVSTRYPYYKHYILFLDKDFNMVKKSNPFKFSRYAIEFVGDIREIDGQIYISVSIGDELNLVQVYDKDVLFKSIGLQV